MKDAKVTVHGSGGDWSIFRPKAHLAAGRKAENMDLSPWHCRRGQSHFRGDEAGLSPQRPFRRENRDSPHERKGVGDAETHVFA